MKSHLRSTFLVMSAGCTLAFTACQKDSASSTAPVEPSAAETTMTTSAPTLETVDQRVSYGIGRNIAVDMTRETNIAVDHDALIAGIRDVMTGTEARLTDEEIGAAFQTVRDRVQQAERAAIADEEAKALAFLETNAARPEVTVTSSGLQYEILTAGDGPKPTADNRVKVHYHGTLIDGTVFDSSVQRGEPIEFPVTGVIPGWVEALQLMPTGSKWKLFIPPALGYGERGSGKIPGGAALVFEVELLEVK